jgi:hypothetical protein
MREGNFNIITGEVKKDYPLNSGSRRFSSQNELKRAKTNGEYIIPHPSAPRKLGTSSDSKHFAYTYSSNDPKSRTITHPENNSGVSGPKASLINASKIGFNIINHVLAEEKCQNVHEYDHRVVG